SASTNLAVLQSSAGSPLFGIGTSTPAARLDVYGGARVTSGTSAVAPTSGAGMELEYDADGSAGALSGGSRGSLIQSFNRDSSAWRDLWIRGNNIAFDGNNTTRMYISSTGLVGVGTSTPYSKLSVWGSGTQNLFELVTSASTTALLANSSGDVGIGT